MFPMVRVLQTVEMTARTESVIGTHFAVCRDGCMVSAAEMAEVI